MRVASENIPNQGVGVVSVNLANNGLRDVRGVEGLATTFPDLKVDPLCMWLMIESESPAEQYRTQK
jgi:hypothetical protein